MTFTRAALALSLTTLAIAVPPVAAQAATITVNTEQDAVANDGSCSLREAISAANLDSGTGGCAAGSGADTIELPAGLYRLAIPGAGEDANAGGDLDVSADLTLHGAGAGKTSIDAAGLDRAIDTGAGTTVAISGVTITGGHAPDGAGGALGANGSGQAGGAGGDGGGIRSRGALALTDCAVEDNFAGDGGTGGNGPGPDGKNGSGGTNGFGGSGGQGGRGGGIFSAGPVSLTRCTVTGNRGGRGGDGGDAVGGVGSLPISASNPGGPGGSALGGTGGTGGTGGLAGAAPVTVTTSTVAANVGGDAGPGGFGVGGAGGFGSPSGSGAGGVGGSGGGGFSTKGGAGGIEAVGVASIADSTLRGNRGGDSSSGGVGVGGDGGQGGAVAGAGGFGGYGNSGLSGDGGPGALSSAADTTISGTTLSANTGGDAASGAPGYGGKGGAGGASGGKGGIGGTGYGGLGGDGGTGGAITAGASTVTNVTIHGNASNGGSHGGAGSGGNGGPGGIGGGVGGKGGNGWGGKGGAGGAGALNPTSGSLQAVHATITANTAAAGGPGGAANAGAGGPSGGGGAGAGGGTSAGSDGSAGAGITGGTAVNLTNTIVSSNLPINCAKGAADGGHDISFGDVSCPGSHVDPALGGLRDNGGPSDTQALRGGSPARDAVPAGAAGCAGADQRGVSRPKGPGCDIGAYETAPAEVTTGAASGISPTGAAVAGTVVANARPAAFHVEFGTTDAYGSRSADQDAGSGVDASPVSTDLTALQPSTTYHYRLVATNADGTALGADQTFTTPAEPGPQASPPPDGGTFKGVIVKKGTVTVRKGVALLRVTCPKDTVGRCAGILTLTKTVKPTVVRRLKLGRAKLKIAPGKTAKVRVRLLKAGRRELKRHPRLKTTATATATDGRGTKKVTRARVRLKPGARR